MCQAAGGSSLELSGALKKMFGHPLNLYPAHLVDSLLPAWEAWSFAEIGSNGGYSACTSRLDVAESATALSKLRAASIMLLAVCATGTRQVIKLHQRQAIFEVAEKMHKADGTMDDKTGHKCCVCLFVGGECQKGSYGYATRSSTTHRCGLFQRCWDEDPENRCSAMGM